ncbi:MAG TPA: hypothetical protein VMG60_14590 [Burkholderiaceae bacterium]|nr:hypothetical protein [Burkholderiaceae bacterium]
MSEIHVAPAGHGHTASIHELAIRAVCLLGGGLWFALALALYNKWSWATSLWPWPDVGMSFVFLASIAAAIGAPLVWIGTTGEFAAFAGIGINTLVVNAGATVYLALRWARWEEPVSGPIAVTLGATALGAGLYLWSRKIVLRDPRPMPTLVRRAFVAFAATLVAVGTALTLQAPHVFPWNLQTQDSVLFGLIFLGAATYFLHAVAHPRWSMGAPPLWSFLAYDVVLFAPYLRLLGGSSDGATMADYYGSTGGTASVNVASLSVYLAVLAASTLLALYMFLIDARTRVIRRRARGG